MKKLIVTLAIVFASVSVSRAQDVFEKGDFVAHVGLGLGTYLKLFGYKTSVPPILTSGEYCITNALINNGKGYVGVGGYLAYTSYKHDWGTWLGEEAGWKTSYIIFGARGAFHYQLVDNLDTYAGVMLGYQVASTSYYGPSGWTGDADVDNSIADSYFVGARYYFTDNIAAFAELGYGIAALEFGLAIKF